MYFVWGSPAVLMGLVVLFAMTDRPSQRALAHPPRERQAIEGQLAREREDRRRGDRERDIVLRCARCFIRPAILLAWANLLVVVGHYGIDSFLPASSRAGTGSASGRWAGSSCRPSWRCCSGNSS
jgi:sugar phosphate permease